ncbi:MAG: hypothetical protein ABIF77_12420 [bacterium]
MNITGLRHGLAVLAVLLATSGHAATDATPREGWSLGFSLGLGPGAMDRNEALAVEGVEHEAIPIAQERGASLSLMGDYSLLPELSAGGEFAFWSQRADEGLGRARLNFSLLTLPLTWYLGGGGFFVRGGPGVGVAQVDFYERGIHESGHDYGFGFLFAAGYEWRLNDRLAICPRTSYSFFGAEEYGVWASFASYAIGCHWYLQDTTTSEGGE